MGVPYSGKTTLAVARALARARARGCPLVAIDPGRVKQFRGFPRASSPAELVELVYEHREPFAVFSPAGVLELEEAIRALRAGKDVVLLVDEAHTYLSAQSGSSSELVHTLREGQHARADTFLVTQHLSGDVPQSALSCTTMLHVFRCTSPRVLRLLESEWGVPRARVATLPPYRFLSLRIGF